MSVIREAILEGEGIELVIDEPNGWFARVGSLRQKVCGRTAAEVLLKLAEIVLGPESSRQH